MEKKPYSINCNIRKCPLFYVPELSLPGNKNTLPSVKEMSNSSLYAGRDGARLFTQHKVRKGLISKPIYSAARSVAAALRHDRRTHSHQRSRGPTLVLWNHRWCLSKWRHGPWVKSRHPLVRVPKLTMRGHWMPHARLLRWNARLWCHHSSKRVCKTSHGCLAWPRQVTLVFWKLGPFLFQ